MRKNIGVAGDWHGQPDWAIKVVESAKRNDLDRIIQVGDFGLWDHQENGIIFLDRLNASCRENGVVVYWLDGNHENFDRLDWYRMNNPKDSMGFTFIRSHIRYSPRGHRWEWAGKSFMTVGGAVSIDRHMRTPSRSWWEQEQFTDKELMGLTQQADYLFTHDCPTNAPFKFLIDDPDSHIHRQRMDKVGRVVQPKVWFHGHMHDKYIYSFRHQAGESDVIGLTEDGDTFNWGILNIPTGKFKWGWVDSYAN